MRRNLGQIIADLRNAFASMVATQPLPKTTEAVSAYPLNTQQEADETFAAVNIQLGQIMDYFARLRAQQAVDTVNLPNVLRAYMRSDEGKQMLRALLLNDPTVDAHFDSRAVNIVDLRINQATIRDRWHVPSLFSWLGAVIGAAVGAVIGIILNVFVDANPISGSVEGKQIVVGTIIDTWYAQTGIVACFTIAFAALGAALLQRRDRDDH